MTTQSAELLRRSEAEVARLRKQASEHTARVEKAQLRMQDMREQLGSAQVGGGGEGDRGRGRLGSGAGVHTRRARAALASVGQLERGAWGRGDKLQSPVAGAEQGRVLAARQEDPHEGGSAGTRNSGVLAKRACWAGRGSHAHLAAISTISCSAVPACWQGRAWAGIGQSLATSGCSSAMRQMSGYECSLICQASTPDLTLSGGSGGGIYTAARHTEG